MMRRLLVKAVADKPAHGDVDVCLAHQLAVMRHAAKQSGEHQADRHLGIDTRSTIIETIAVSGLIAKPRQVQNTSDAHEHMVVRNELSQGPRELQLTPLLAPKHAAPPPIANHSRQRNQALAAFSTAPLGSAALEFAGSMRRWSRARSSSIATGTSNSILMCIRAVSIRSTIIAGLAGGKEEFRVRISPAGAECAPCPRYAALEHRRVAGSRATMMIS
jgi:hypothetical protein